MATITVYNDTNVDDACYPTWVAITGGTTVAASSVNPAAASTPWTERTLSESVYWYDCCFGDKVVVALGYSDIGSFSYNGINWADFSLPSYETWFSVAYGNGSFVTVPYSSNKSAVSNDGAIWISGGNLPSTAEWVSVVYGPTVSGVSSPTFVTIAFRSNKVARSVNNGASWEAVTNSTTDDWSAMCFGNDRFVAIARNSSGCTYSTDGGNSWISSSLPASRYWQRICYGNGVFVAFASNTNVAAWSEDGITWYETQLPSSAAWQSISYGRIQTAANQGLYVFTILAISGTVSCISYDGKVWTAGVQLNATYMAHCYCPFPWNSGDTLSIQNNAIVSVTTNQTKFWNAITATYGKLKISNDSNSVGNYFQMGRTSGSAACSLTIGSGLFSIDIDGNWIYLDDGDGSVNQTFTIPFTEYIPMIEVETSVSGVYEQWLNVTGAFGPYMKIFRKDGLEWVGNGKRGNYFVQTPSSNPLEIITVVSGTTTNGSYYITYDSNSSILPGANITGTGIPNNTVVNRIVSSTKAELNVVCTATNTGLTFTVYNPMRSQLINQISVGDGINGNIIPLGRHVRVPNLMISNTSPANYGATSHLTETYIIMTNACPIDARICYFGLAYVYLNQPSLVYFRNVGFSYPFYLNECYDVDMDYVGIAASPAYWYYTTRWICRDQRWGVAPPVGYTAAGAGTNSTWSYIHNAVIKNFHYVVYTNAKIVGSGSTHLITISLTNNATLENIRISCLWNQRALYGLYLSDSCFYNTINNLEVYGISPIALNTSSDNTITNFEYSLGMNSTIRAFKTAMRICDDPATASGLVDNTKYYLKLRSFRGWMGDDYYDSNEYSVTPFQGGWQFPAYISVRPTETIAPSVTIDWIARVPSPALVTYEIYRSTTPGFTERTPSNRVYGSLTSATVTCAQGQKVVSNSAAARIMTFSASAKTIVLSGASAGTWAGTDYFQVGDTIYIEGSYNGNNGAKTITALSTVTMTVAETLYDEVASLNPIVQIYKLTSKSSSTRAFTFAVGKTITVGAGQAWTTVDGFAVGDVIDITGSRRNDGTFTINTLTVTVMTVNELMRAEVTPTSTSATTTRIFTFSASGKTLTATGTSAGNFITDGHFIGDLVYVANSVNNPGPYTISNLTSTVMTFNETPVDETCPAGTVVYRKVTITIRAPIPGTRYYYRFRKYNFNSIAALQCSSPGLLLTSNRAVSSNVATITTALAHGFIAGQSVTVSGLGDSSYNGTFTISTVPTTTSFTYPLTHGNESTGDALGTVVGADIMSTYRSVLDNVATITTNIPHKFVPDQSIVISGMTDPTYNGTFKITAVPTTTTFTYPLTHVDETSTADTSGKMENITMFSAATSKDITVTTPISVSSGSKTMTFSSSAKSIVLGSGSWLTDGHLQWDSITISGSAAGNDGTFTISALSATTLNVLETLYDEVGDADPVITVTGLTYALVTTTIAHGLSFGQEINVTGFSDSAYNGNFHVRAVPSTTTLSYPVVHANASIVYDNAGKISNTNLDFDNVYYLSGFQFESGTNRITNLVNNIYNSMFAPGIEIAGQGIASGTKVVSVDPSGRDMIIDKNTTTSTDTIFATTFTITRRTIISNVATIETSVAHNLDIGSKIRLTEMSDSTYNGTFVVTVVPSATKLRFALTHVNESVVNLSGILTVVDIVLTIPVQVGMGVYGAIGTTEGIRAGTMVASKENSYMVTLTQKPTFQTSYTIVTFNTFNESAEFTCVPNMYKKSMNFCLQSSDFSTTWVNSNITYAANTYQSPIVNDFATATLDSLTATSTSGTRTMTVTGLKPLSDYCASVWVRADQTSTVPSGVSGCVSLGGNNTNFTATNELKRYSSTATTASGVTSLNVVVGVSTNGQVIHAGQVMVNEGTTPKADITTTTTATDLFPCATPIGQLRTYCKDYESTGTSGNQGVEVNLGTAATGEYYHEIHVSTTPDFTPSSSTLATSSFASDTSHISFVAQCHNNKILNINKLDAGSSAAALGVIYLTGTSTNNVIMNGDIDIQYCNSATIPIIYLLTGAHNNLIHNIDFGRIKNYTGGNLIFTQSTNALTGNRIQNIRALNYDVPISPQMQNSIIKGLPSGRAIPGTTATTYAIGGAVDGVAAVYTAVYDSQFSELYNSATEGLLCIVIEDSQKDINPYTIKAGTPTFTNTGRLHMTNAGSVATVNRSRNNNIATIETAQSHKVISGDEIIITSVSGIGYNGTVNVDSVIDSLHFTYECAGDNETEISDSNGIVTVGDSIEWLWPYLIKGVSGFRKLFPKILTADLGTQTDIADGLRIDVSINTAGTWSDYVEATPSNLNNLIVSPTNGFYFKTKFTALPFMKYGTMTNPIYPGDVIIGARSSVTAVVVKNNNYGLTGTLILSKISGTFYPLEILALSNNTTRSTTYRAVSSNVATITTSTAHGMAVGYWVDVAGMADTTYNGRFVVASVPSSTTFTYALVRANEGSTSDTGGTVTIYRNLATNVTTNGFAIGPSFTSLLNVVQFFTTYNDQNTLYPSTVYPLVVNVVDSSLNPIEGARVRVTVSETVGDYTEGDVILSGLTNSLGSISTDIESLLDISIFIRVRKATSAPFYKTNEVPAIFEGGVGLNTTLVLVLDQ